LSKDLDVLLELIICYASLRSPNLSNLLLFLHLAFKLAERRKGISLMFERGCKNNFIRYYHQCFLFVLLLSSHGDRIRASMASEGSEADTFRRLFVRQRFLRSLRKLDITRTFGNFIRLRDEPFGRYYRKLLDRHSKALVATGVVQSAIGREQSLAGMSG
jgi:hypothetical protein